MRILSPHRLQRAIPFLLVLTGGPWAAAPSVAGVALAAVADAATPAAAAAADAAFEGETRAWQARRLQRLTADDGWLTLVGLDWLEPGENRFGSDPGNRIVLHAAGIPPVAGALFLEHGALRVVSRAEAGITLDGKAVTETALIDDTGGKPSILRLGTLSIQVVKRGDRWAARVKDNASPVRTAFQGLEWYPPDPRFRVEATLHPYPPGKTLPIANILGFIEQDPSPGALEFDLLGQHYQVEPVQEEDSEDLFLMIADQTSGKETYGAGRYIAVTRSAAAGRWIIDFNRAYNPPCSFTAFATCPLPPKGNRLPLAVTAGEKRYAGGQ